ncbi:MAG: PilZ domain-containing protein, partial [Desulfobacterales bacterium]
MEKLEPAKERLQLIKSFAQDEESQTTQSARRSDADTQVSSTERKVLYAVTRRSSVEAESEEAVSISKAQLINKINFINFQDRTLLLNFKHRKYQTPLTLLAAPQPCLGDDLECSWAEPDKILRELPFYEFENLLIPDGQNLIRVESELVRMDADAIRLRLPEIGYEVSSRTMLRHRCENINAQLIQNSSLFSGTLIDFNACTLKIELTVEPPRTFDWINPESPVNLMLSDASGTHYTGECKIIRQSTCQNTGTYILRPLRFEIQRFKHKEFRSQRYKITPSPNIRFRHPFTRQIFDLKVIDLSGSGFSVEEDEHTAVLLPGMILPQLELNFANSFQFQCKAQVVYRKVIDADHNAKKIKCGLALLDMDIHDHVKLVGLLHQAKDEKSYICNNV